MNLRTNRYLVAAALGTVCLALAACSENNDSAMEETAEDAYERTSESLQNAGESMENAAESVADATADTWNSIKEATYDERATFRENVNEMAASVDAKLEEWGDETREFSADAKETWNEGVAELRDARAALDSKLDELGDATAETWNNARSEIAEAWERVKDAYENLEQQIQS